MRDNLVEWPLLRDHKSARISKLLRAVSYSVRISCECLVCLPLYCVCINFKRFFFLIASSLFFLPCMCAGVRISTLMAIEHFDGEQKVHEILSLSAFSTAICRA